MIKLMLYILSIFFLSVLYFEPLHESHAHRNGCHSAHSCPSDTGSYVCGDKGVNTYCGNNDEEYKEDEEDDKNTNYETDDEQYSSQYNWRPVQPSSDSKDNFEFEHSENDMILNFSGEDSRLDTKNLENIPNESFDNTISNIGDVSLGSEYTDRQLGISLSYPSDWEIRDIKKGFQVFKEGNTYVEIRSDQLESHIGLTEYVSNYIDGKKESRIDFDLIHVSNHELSENIPAYFVEYTFTKSKEDGMEISEESTLKIYRIITNIENKIYNLAYISDILNYNSNLDIAEQIINSIQIFGP